MKVIFEEYSGIIITAVAIVALIAIIGLMLATDGPVHESFTKLITQLFSEVGLPQAGS